MKRLHICGATRCERRAQVRRGTSTVKWGPRSSTLPAMAASNRAMEDFVLSERSLTLVEEVVTIITGHYYQLVE